ncbi:GIY-YIG nuclease family protein [Nonomuraea sp. NPDC046802]|uniref:GIY-YIG nuclease family protein n=1 Tax=Nonomuraea sp. NPDC046802 TaxID=3154919 RepID=UPI0033FD61E3
MTKSNGKPFELLQWEDPDGVSPVGLPERHEYWRYVGYVYVVELSNGLIKIGRTANPRKRMEQHLRQAGPFELKIVRLWLSVVHRDPVQVEKLLLSYGRQHSTAQVLDEYFKGLGFASTVRFAATVDHEPVTEVTLAELAKQEREAREASPFFQATRAAMQGRTPTSSATPQTPGARLVAAVLGANSDGSIRLPDSLDADLSVLEPLISQVAQLRNLNGQVEALDPTWMDMVETLVVSMVTTEFNILRQRMYKENLKHLWTPLIDLCDEVRPWSGLRCDDCGSEAHAFRGGWICSGCGRKDPETEEQVAHTTDYLFAIEGGR